MVILNGYSQTRKIEKNNKPFSYGLIGPKIDMELTTDKRTPEYRGEGFVR